MTHEAFKLKYCMANYVREKINIILISNLFGNNFFTIHAMQTARS